VPERCPSFAPVAIFDCLRSSARPRVAVQAVLEDALEEDRARRALLAVRQRAETIREAQRERERRLWQSREIKMSWVVLTRSGTVGRRPVL